MINRVWLLETSDGNYEAFKNLEDAKDYAVKLLMNWGYDPKSEADNEVYKELNESYKEERYAGFWVDDLLWCYEINYHS